MSSNKFIDQKKGAWQRLEDLLSLLRSTSLRKLHREEVRELGRSYRRTASDLAVARAESRDPRVISYLNSLVIRAHGQIYQAEANTLTKLRSFIVNDVPQTFRKTWRYTLVATLVFWSFFALGFLGTRHNADFSEFASVDAQTRYRIEVRKSRWWKELEGNNEEGAARILTNNIRVAILAFAFGALFGIGSLYILAQNGLQVGAILALVYRAGYGNELLTFMVGHGTIELSCIFISGGAGMAIGYALLVPGDISRGQAFKQSGLRAVKLVVACAALLVFAGIIEGFISPSGLSAKIKFSISIITGVALYAYLLLSGLKQADAASMVQPVRTS